MSSSQHPIDPPSTPSSRKTPKISRAMIERVKNIKSTFLIDVDTSQQQQPTSITTSTNNNSVNSNTTKIEDKSVTLPKTNTNNNNNNKINIEVIELPETPVTKKSELKASNSTLLLDDITKSISKNLSLSSRQQQEQSTSSSISVSTHQKEEEEEEIFLSTRKNKPSRRLVLLEDSEDESDKPLNIIGKLEKEMGNTPGKPLSPPLEETVESKPEKKAEQEEEEEENITISKKKVYNQQRSRKIVEESDTEEDGSESVGDSDEDDDDDPFEDENEDTQKVDKPSRLKKIELVEDEEDDEEGESIGTEDSEDDDEDDEEDEDDDDFIVDDDDDDEDYEDSEEEEEDEYIPPPPKRKTPHRPVVIESEESEEEEDEEEEEEEEEEVVNKKSTSTSASSLKNRKGNNTTINVNKYKKEEIEEEVDEEKGNGNDKKESKSTQDEYEDQNNGFLKNLRTGNYHNSLQHENKEEFIVPGDTYDSLFWYQREGVDWMWRLFCRKAGGILGDDMGLGKTLQIISFLKSMHHGKFIKHTLVAMPVSLIEHWVNEFKKKEPKINVRVYHGTNVKERENNLEFIKRNGGVLITTYGMIVSNSGPLKEYKRKTFKWDYIILDEGHKIKETKTKINKTIRQLTANFKIIMTGTAIQNNLKELWSLFDWVCNGTLLGSIRSFSMHFQNPILRAHISDSTFNEKKMGSAVAESLRQLIAPHFLRREKKDVFPSGNSNNGASDPSKQIDANNSNNENIDPNNVQSPTNSESSTTSSSSSSSSTSSLKSIKTKRMSVRGIKTRKNDLVCWIKMAQPQIDLYRVFLESPEVKNALNKTSSPLAACTVLKKISDHPVLIHEEMKTCNTPEMLEIMKQIGENQTIKSLVRNSGKMQFLYYLLPNLKEEGHRILIFSQSVKMLNAIQLLLDTLNLTYLRIDGSITSTKERQKKIDEFNNDRSYFCFLLTIQVGALGINLTSADRVLIFDPSWTTVDNQAVDRVYRIGQQRDVVVYRLITCGTIEEKIYRKQVFKGSLMKSMLNQEKGQHRYFSHDELRQLFILDDPFVSQTQRYLEDLHSKNRKSSPELDLHLQFLMKFKMVFGISDHDLLFSEEVAIDHTEDDLKQVQEMKDASTPSKQPSKKKITIRDTPGKTQVNRYIYLNDEYDEDEEEMVVDRVSSSSSSPPTGNTTSTTTSTTSTPPFELKRQTSTSSIDLNTGKEVIHIHDDENEQIKQQHKQQQTQQPYQQQQFQKQYQQYQEYHRQHQQHQQQQQQTQKQQSTQQQPQQQQRLQKIPNKEKIEDYNKRIKRISELYKQGKKIVALNYLIDSLEIHKNNHHLETLVKNLMSELQAEKDQQEQEQKQKQK